MKLRSGKPIVVAISMALALISAVALAQQRGPYPGRMMDRPRYEAATEVTLTGTVEKVEEVSRPCPRGEGGTHLWLEAGGSRYEVHLGPSSFLEANGWSFSEGDSLQVTGSQAEIEGTASILAREVTRGEKSLTLRYASGMPVWRRGPNR